MVAQLTKVGDAAAALDEDEHVKCLRSRGGGKVRIRASKPGKEGGGGRLAGEHHTPAGQGQRVAVRRARHYWVPGVSGRGQSNGQWLLVVLLPGVTFDGYLKYLDRGLMDRHDDGAAVAGHVAHGTHHRRGSSCIQT